MSIGIFVRAKTQLEISCVSREICKAATDPISFSLCTEKYCWLVRSMVFSSAQFMNTTPYTSTLFLSIATQKSHQQVFSHVINTRSLAESIFQCSTIVVSHFIFIKSYISFDFFGIHYPLSHNSPLFAMIP